MAWRIEGTYFETCSCEVVCPCTASLALGADYDRCKVTLVFHVTDGDMEGTDVGGLAVAAVADSPKVMSDGGIAYEGKSAFSVSRFAWAA
jgi:hypothetical protein